MDYTIDTAYFFTYLSALGGVESHLYYLSKKYKDRDWVILYKEADSQQLKRLRENVRCVQVKPDDRFRIRRLFVAYDRSILSQCECEEVYFVIHADYKAQIEMSGLPMGSMEKDDRITKYLAVSKTAQKGYKQPSEVVYMPIVLDTFEPPIFLVSATRLSQEKGLNRMRELARLLDDAKVNYLWHVYTNSEEEILSPNVQFLKPRIDIVSKFPLYDGLVQLSDSESFGLSNQEALMCGVPLISTRLPVLKELGIDDRYSIQFGFDMKVDSDQIERIRHIRDLKKNMPKYVPPVDKWGRYLEGESDYENPFTTVKVLKTYEMYSVLDSELGYIPHEGEIVKVSTSRLTTLLGENDWRKPFVELLENP